MTDVIQVITDGSTTVEIIEEVIQISTPLPVDANTIGLVSQGPQGPQGPQGAQGEAGPGVPAGGAAGDLLVKTGAGDYQTGWTDAPTVDSLTFDVLADESLTAQGQAAWNIDEETVDIQLNGFAMHVGQHMLYHVKNQTGSQIAKGQPVMFAGTDGNSGKLLIQPWNGTGPSVYFMGLTAENIDNDEEGFVVAFGKLRGIQTNGANYGETWINGQVIYAGTTSGSLTKTQAPAPNPHITVCAVVSAHPSNGTLFVRATLGSNIKNDEGVTLTGLSSGQILVANSAGVFENQSISGDVTIDESGIAEVFRESGPQFTYTTGALTRIDYDSGNYKVLAYTDGVLSSVTYYKGSSIITKTFNYVDGALVSIDEVET